MAINDNNLQETFSKENKTDSKESDQTLQQELQLKSRTLKEASVTELISFSKFTIIGVIIFFIGLFIQFLIQNPALPIPDPVRSRFVTAVMGITLLILFGGLVIDVLSWREYTEWGALGAIITYIGVVLIFITFPLNIFWYGDEAEFIYIIMIIGGVITMIIGFTTRATELDQKIVDQFFIFKEWVKAGGIRQSLSALGQLIGTVVRGFFRYIWLGIKELGTRIRRFGGWITRSTRFVLERIWIFLTRTFPNLLTRSLIGLWNNLHWFGLIAVILYLIMIDIPIPNADPLVLKAELMIIIVFFFCLGVLYPQRDRVVIIAKTMRNTVLSGLISAYSMLSGTKIKADQSVFCSRCLRGVERREFVSLMEIKGMIDPPCPFCGFNSWIGSENVSIPIDKLKQMEKHEIPTAQTVVKDTPPSEIVVAVCDEKAMKKGRFPDYQSYQRAQNLGVQTYSELEYLDRLGAPDLVTADKIKQSGFSHIETFQKALAVGASNISELRLVEELQVPDLVTAKAIQQGRFPDYQSYRRAQDLGVKDYSDLQYIDGFGAPDTETADKIRKSGFPDYKSYQQAQNLGARTYSELQFITKKNGITSTDVETGTQALAMEEPKEVKPSKPIVRRTDIEIQPVSKIVQEAEISPIPGEQIIGEEAFRFTKDRESLKQAIEIFDGIFSDQTLEPKRSQELLFWNKKKSWFSTQRKRFLRGNLSTGMFYDKMKSLNEDLRSTFRIPEERFQTIKPQEPVVIDKKVSDLLKEILKLSERFTATNKEVDEWYDWFTSQTDQYLKSQIDDEIFIKMLKRSQEFYLGIDSEKMPLEELRDYEVILTIIHTVQKMIISSWGHQIVSSTSREQINDVGTQSAQEAVETVVVEKTVPDLRKVVTKEKISLQKVVGNFDSIFADDSLVREENREKWDRYMKEYYQLRARFLDFGEISGATFCSHLGKVREAFITEMGISSEKIFDFKDIEIDYAVKAKIQTEKQLSLPTVKKFTAEEKGKIPATAKEKVLMKQVIECLNTIFSDDAQKKVVLKPAIECLDTIFSDDSMITHLDFQNWNEYKKEYYHKRARHLDYGEISEISFYSYLKKLREAFITEMGEEEKERPDKQCSSCGVSIYPEASQYCSQCGTKLTD